MSRQNVVFALIEESIKATENRLLSERSLLRNLLMEKHSIEDNEAAYAKIVESERLVSELHRGIINSEDISFEFRAQAKDLCDRCRALDEITRDMFNALYKDLKKLHRAEDELRRAEDKKKEGVFQRILFLSAITTGLIAAANAGVGKKRVTVEEAAVFGIFASTAIIFHGKITTTAKTIGKNMYSAPKLIGAGAKEVFNTKAMDTRIGVIMGIDDSRNAIRSGLNQIATRSNKFLAKIKKNQKPKL